MVVDPVLGRGRARPSDPQIKALRQLAKAPAGRCPTSTSTDGRYVAGNVGAALVRRGFARNVAVDASGDPIRRERWSSGIPDEFRGFQIEITDDGRLELTHLGFGDHE